jgi:hypothetical protein
MRKIITAALAITLVAAVAHAQPPRGGPRGAGPGSGPPPGGPGPAAPVAANQIVLTGVVLAVDPVAERVTIAYEASEALNWPAGAMPFAMSKPGLLGDIQVRQKVRFRLDSHRIAEFLPVAAPGGPASEGPRSNGPPPPPAP